MISWKDEDENKDEDEDENENEARIKTNSVKKVFIWQLGLLDLFM